MTIASWCVLAAALLPYVWVALAKYVRGYDNHAPRDFEARLSGWRKRAYWAQLNGYEAFAPFAAAVIIAQQVVAEQQVVDALAVAFVFFRLLHGLLYIGDQPTLRSAIWTAGMLCVLGLFVAAA